MGRIAGNFCALGHDNASSPYSLVRIPGWVLLNFRRSRPPGEHKAAAIARENNTFSMTDGVAST